MNKMALWNGPNNVININWMAVASLEEMPKRRFKVILIANDPVMLF